VAELKVGGEIDSYCTKCKLVLAHTILAVWAGSIKRVRCNTCMGEHGFRKAAPAPSSGHRPSKPKPAESSKATEHVSAEVYQTLIEGRDRSSARPYSLKEKLQIGDLLSHPAFGLGIVASARGPEKVDVVFPGGVKTLLHNRGAGPAQLAKPLPHKVPDVELAESSTEDPTAETSDEPEGALG
jgi:hypothetical protein